MKDLLEGGLQNAIYTSLSFHHHNPHVNVRRTLPLRLFLTMVHIAGFVLRLILPRIPHSRTVLPWMVEIY
jgi:hypothetical protein